MQKEYPTRIDPSQFETEIYSDWLEKNYFHADETSSKPPYSIVIPPPNVTGSLHMGHALNNTLQDIMIRFHKLNGYETMWMPGTDHAGIATQNVVEKLLASEGTSRHELGREKFIERVWQWKEQSGGTIINQLKRLGCACDWERERFTMDEGLSKAVRKVFVSLYKEGLIYRAKNYLVNWCPRCHTALSDLEVEHEEVDGAFYHLLYPVKDSDYKFEVATTRPETMLGDTAVAVHPDDERYSHLIGKTVLLPIMNREIPVIADEYVDMEMGVGCLKVTPAHDPNDFLLGQKHDLESISVMDENGNINELGGEFAGMDRFEARKKIIEKMDELGLFIKKIAHKHQVGHCYRCKTVIEPKLSDQWFIKIKPLAEEAVKAVETGQIKLKPEIWHKTYYNWMNDIRDWCISRQIWWGHRIPAWYCDDCGEITVEEHDPSECTKCNSKNIHQETDVLDTWFSSGLWPFSTQGWPEETATLEKFYPTSCLITGFDILFFWVARMMMFGLKFQNGVEPFKEIYLHALIRDKDGQKMSKSKGNVIDPLTMIEKYGADAFRFTMAAFAAQGRDIKLDEARIDGYRNFVNKIWNASRFIMTGYSGQKIDFDDLRTEDKWILQNLKEAEQKVSKAVKNYDFNEAAGAMYQFFWHKFCDWYIELIKPRIYNEEQKDKALGVAAYVLENSLVLLHPLMPFLTEYIYKLLTEKESVMLAKWPEPDYDFSADKSEMDEVTELIGLIRNIRGEYNIAPSKTLSAFVKTEKDDVKATFEKHTALISNLARLENLNITDKTVEKAASNISGSFEVFVPLEGLVDFEAEVAKLKKELKKLEKDHSIYGGKLKNENYLNNAKPEVIAKDREKFAEIDEKLNKVNETIERLSGLC